MFPSRAYNLYSNLHNIIHSYYHIKQILTSLKRIPCQPVKIKHTCQLASLINLLGLYGPFQNTKIDKYWTPQTFDQLLEEADRLYGESKYLDVYEILNRIQFYQNIEIQWRICRALFKMSCDIELTSSVRRNMITEAYGLIIQTLELEDSHPEVHKWTAILLDARASLNGTWNRVKTAAQVKYHMLKSLDLNAHDPGMLYMLGSWCYTLTNLDWLQKLLVKLVFADLPETRLDEAYQYFLRAEQMCPRFFVGNMYMLGRCCYDMGYFYRARYYFTLAAELPVHSDVERKFRQESKFYAEKLKDYDIHLYSIGN